MQAPFTSSFYLLASWSVSFTAVDALALQTCTLICGGLTIRSGRILPLGEEDQGKRKVKRGNMDVLKDYKIKRKRVITSTNRETMFLFSFQVMRILKQRDN